MVNSVYQIYAAKKLMQKNEHDRESYHDYRNLAKIEEEKLKVFSVAIEEIYGIEYDLVETEAYISFETKEGNAWLVKIGKEE